MTRVEIADIVADKLNYPKSHILNVLNSAFSVMTEGLASGDRVKISRFGSFRVVEQKGAKYVTFKTSRKVKDKLKESAGAAEVE